MEKLIELLNEREKTVNWVQHPWWCKEHLEYQCHWPRVINKRFWFIKWLVDNDKIDRESENYPLKKYYPYFNDDVLAIVSQDCNTYEDECRVCYDKYESLLMLLSIQDNPIEFLISILK